MLGRIKRFARAGFFLDRTANQYGARPVYPRPCFTQRVSRFIALTSVPSPMVYAVQFHPAQIALVP